jgi:type IV pilus assembly protein PilB
MTELVPLTPVDARWADVVAALCQRGGGGHVPLADALIELGEAKTRELAGWDGFDATRVGRAPMPVGAACATVRLLGIERDAKVLVVGLPDGLTLSLLAALTDNVWIVDRDLDALDRRIAPWGLKDLEVRQAEGAEGWREHAPFDAILIGASRFDVPDTLLGQLRKPGGRLVMAVGPRRASQTLLSITANGQGRYVEATHGLVGQYALFGELAVLMGAASQIEVDAAVKVGRERGMRLGDVLRASGAVDEQELVRVLAAQRGVFVGSVESLMKAWSPASVGFVPRSYVDHMHLVPLSLHDGRLVVAALEDHADPVELQRALRAPILELHLVTPTDWKRLLNALDLSADTPVEAAGSIQLVEAEEPEYDQAIEDYVRGAARPVALLETLLLDAIGERATDIHIERYGDTVRTRLRIDGDLRDLPRFRISVEECVALINVVKICSGLDISERRRPQGGRMRRRTGGQIVDMRVQTQLSLHGEHVVIRLLPHSAARMTMDRVGFPPSIAAAYRRLLEVPAGLVLVVGPTGSGKSTTLYTGLNVLADDATRKVITIEDPIEYSIQGVQQTQVNPEIGFLFADAMRSFVRQDPDVILLGEIRDAESALEALRASQTGHLVLSTLHANDTIDAVQRLRDLGQHPNSIASELAAVFAQRLARRICDGCRQPHTPTAEHLAEVYPDGVPADFRAYRGTGCVRCDGTGQRGRVGVFEFLTTGPDVRRAIAHGLAVDELRDVALRAGLLTMRTSALEHVYNGVIAFEELRRILTPERLRPEAAVER